MEPNNRRGSSTPPGLEQRSASSGAGGLRSWNQNRTQRPPGQWSHLTKENQPTWEVNVALWTRYPRWWYPKYPSEVRHEHRPSGPRRRAQRETSRFLTSIGSLERTPRFTSPKPTLIRVRRDQTGSSIRQQHLWLQQLQNKQRSRMGVRRPKASPLIYIFPSFMHVPSLTVPCQHLDLYPLRQGPVSSGQLGYRAHSEMEFRNNGTEKSPPRLTRQLCGQNSALSPGSFPILLAPLIFPLLNHQMLKTNFPIANVNP